MRFEKLDTPESIMKKEMQAYLYKLNQKERDY